MNRDEITRKTSELSTPDTPAISLLKTVIRRKKKWHFSRAILPFRLAKRKSLSNAWEKSAGSPAERPLPLQRRNSIRIPKSHTTKPHKSTCTRPTTPQNAGSDHRNHCPNCLSSLHVDIEPGNRASDCGGIMEPVAVWVRRGGEWAIIHRCKRCGALSSNRVAADDNPMKLMSIAMKPLCEPPFPLDRIEEMTALMGGDGRLR